jgi:DNA-binding beta-propeller fold protein YncE
MQEEEDAAWQARRVGRSFAVRARVCLLVAALCCLAAPAPGLAAAAGPAAPSHELTLILAGFIEEPGHKPVPPPEGEYEDACGVAFDPAGDIVISDYYHRLLYVYDSGDTYRAQTAVPGPDGPCNLAFDPAGNLYVNDWRRDVVRYRPIGGLEFGEPTVIDSAGSTGVTVDPVSGRIYVDDRTYVAVYEPSGEPVLVAGLPLRIGEGSLGSGYGVAVSGFPATEGEVYVPDAAAGLVRVYGPGGEELESITGLGTPQRGFTSLQDANAAVDPATGHLYVVDDLQPGYEHPAAAVDEFNSAGEYRGRLPQQIVDAEPSALAISGGEVYVTSGNDENAVLYGFGPTLPAHHLSVSLEGEGHGTVTSEPAGINCPGACGAEYDVGEELFLTAVPEPGSAFVGWSGAGCTTAVLCHLLLGSDTTIEAEFAVAPAASVARSSAAGPDTSPSAAATEVAAVPHGGSRDETPAEASLALVFPGPGRLSIAGRYLDPQRLAVGTRRRLLHLRLDRAGEAALAASPNGHLEALARVRFAGGGGGPVRTLRVQVGFDLAGTRRVTHARLGPATSPPEPRRGSDRQ